MNTHEKADILNQLAQIKLMERGKLSARVYKDRSGDAPQHFKLQCWAQGKNHTRHVPADQLALLQEALAGYAKFEELIERLAQLIIADTREQLRQVGSGLKKRVRRPRCSWRKPKKSKG
jgi:hypothetical protein